ncbi:MAG: LutB/LldF family L-lactate oxidation iron-sulfur protein [Dongiaceae bacterium]
MSRITSANFSANARAALADKQLQVALGHVRHNFIERRAKAIAELPEFDALRDAARDIRDHVLNHLDLYLERFEAKVIEHGGQVHWCDTADQARATILSICRGAGAKTVTKGKTMIGEEIAINAFLAENGIVPVETDLGEYIIQLRGETPSHLIAPAIHVTKNQVSDTFRAHHTDLDPLRSLEEPQTLLAEAREKLRSKFLAADVGITGANFLIAETGQGVIVTNEGNGDLTQTLPKTQIVLASIEKIAPTLEDASVLLRVLARSATGQEMSVYTSFTTGPRRAGDLDGPENFHVVIVDNGRSRYLGTEFQPMLRCIRCAACLNHCPVYQAVGGHAYGWVYSGPIGAVLTPALVGIDRASPLPEASSLCGRCEQVCPVRIPIPSLLRRWREASFEGGHAGKRTRLALRLWAFAARRPGLYRCASAVAARLLASIAGKRGRIRHLPLAAGWTGGRDLPAPAGRTFMAQYAREKGGGTDDGGYRR